MITSFEFLATWLRARFDDDRGASLVEQAVALNPNDVNASTLRGLWLAYVGRGEEALGSLDADLALAISRPMRPPPMMPSPPFGSLDAIVPARIRLIRVSGASDGSVSVCASGAATPNT